jgi:hypothetical protein
MNENDLAKENKNVSSNSKKEEQTFKVSTLKSRFDKVVKKEEWDILDLIDKLSNTKRTLETVEEYKNLEKKEQDSIKDVGALVGGTFENASRKEPGVVKRTLITLDLDNATVEDTSESFLYNAIKKIPYRTLVYSTHKHSLTNPRGRIVIPLSKEIESEEYEFLGRYFSGLIGIEYFDKTTYQVTRIMYLPSTSKDGVFEFYDNIKHYEEENAKGNKVEYPSILDPKELLSKIENWRDRGTWNYQKSELAEDNFDISNIKSTSDKDTKKLKEELKNKPYPINVFTSVYNIVESITKFIPNTYQLGTFKNRLTYSKGTTSNGVLLYEENTFLFSNHSTDPANTGHLINSFDLVRIHLFKEEDEKFLQEHGGHYGGENKTKLPSYKLMRKLVDNDINCQALKERLDK